KLAFTYFEDGDYTVWMTDNPRRLKGQPFRPKPVIVASGNGNGQAVAESTPEQRADELRRAIAAASQASDTADSGSDRRVSLYRSSSGIRLSAEAPTVPGQRASTGPLSVAQLLDSADLALPDTTEFLHYE